MSAPKPTTLLVLPAKLVYSATMLAFHAPPLAVINPVMIYGNNPGKIKVRQRRQPLSCSKSLVYFKSCGMADAHDYGVDRTQRRHCFVSG